MALIGKIRENSWFLIAAIVLGMGGFLFMDMIGGSRGSSLMGTQNMVGKVEGEKILINNFQSRERAFYGNAGGDSYVQRDRFWNFYVEEILLEKEGEATGLQVGQEELRSLFDGENAFISPTVRQEFVNPQTGVFDVTLVRQYLDQYNELRPDIRAYFDELYNRVTHEQMTSKLSSLVSKAMYTPTWMAESVFKENNVGVNMNYVSVPYTSIDDSEVTVSDEDLKAYLQSNKKKYQTDEPGKDITWVEFTVKPTEDDSIAIQTKIAKLAEEFKAVQPGEDSSFIVDNYGIYNTEYVGIEEISEVVADSLNSAEPGTILGPYLDNGNGQYQTYGFYKTVKLIDTKVVPDSVDSRHILIRVENAKFNPGGVKAAVAQLDSVRSFITDRDSSFVDMAAKYGQDGTASLGGDVGMMGPKDLLPEYRDYIFYESKVGDLGIVVSTAGVHLIEILKQVNTGKVGYRVAYVEEVIVPSDDTQNSIYNQAFEFVRANRNLNALNKSALEMELDKRSASGLGPNEYFITGLGSGEASRSIVQWAFDDDNKVNDVSPEVYSFEDPVEFFASKYVVVGLTAEYSAGLMNVETVRDEITPIVLNKKKAELIRSKIEGKNMNEVASEFGVGIDSLTNVRFNGFSELNGEPKVLGAAFSLNEGETSKPVVGNSGVYLVKLTLKPLAPEATDLASIRRQYSSRFTSRLNNGIGTNELLNAIRERSDVKDRRATFF